MVNPLERVIAEQQAEIDRLTACKESNDRAWERNYKAGERLAAVCFGYLHSPTSHDAMWALKMELQNQGWCLSCECSHCECDED